MKNIFKFGLIAAVLTLIVYGIVAVNRKNTKEDKPPKSNSNVKVEEILSIQKEDNIKGDLSAPLTIVDYSDYQCPYCVRYDKTLNQILDGYPGKVKWVYRHYPLPFHNAAKEAAVAVEAAGVQDKYWEYHDKLVANSEPNGKGLQEEDLFRYAKEIDLNFEQFKSDIKDQKILAKVDKDIKDGNDLGIKGTPASYLIDRNGQVKPIEGALSFDQLKSKIDSALGK